MNRTAINLISVLGGELVLRGANFLAVVAIARLYGSTLLGEYATILAFVTVAVMISDNGLQVASITEIAGQPDQVGGTLGALYALKTILFATLSLVLAAIGLGFRVQTLTWAMAAFLTARTMLYSYCQLHMGALKALDRMPSVGMIQGIHCVALTLGVALSYRWRLPIIILLAWLLACQLLEFLMSGSQLLRCRVRLSWSSISACWSMFCRATPIGVTYSVAALILRADVLVLSSTVSAAEVGYFAAANIPLVMVYVVSWLMSGVLLPRMVQLARDAASLRFYANRWIRVISVTTIPICLIVAWSAPAITRLVYGSGYGTSGRLAAIMALAVPFILTNAVLLSEAIALESRTIYLGTYLGTGAFSLILDFTLGHVYGNVGVGIAIVAREVMMSTAFLILSARIVGTTAGQQARVRCSTSDSGAEAKVV